MKRPPVLPNEASRLAALRATGLLDTEAEIEFDEIVGLAAQICAVPVALISLVDEERQWVKARFGGSRGGTESPRETAFCAHAIADRAPLVVPDALLDARFADNPFVAGEPHIRAYAGVPLVDERGNALGTLCVVDRTPRDLTQEQLHALGALARQAMRLIHARSLAAEARETNARLAESEELFRTAFEAGPGGLVFLALDGRYERVNRAFCQLVGYSEQELLKLSTHDISLPEDRAPTEERFVRARALGDRSLTFQRRFQRKDGSIVWVQVSTRILRDAKGGPRRFVAQYQDISDLKAVDRMKDEFVSTVSHELRTPLTSIRGALGLLESGAVGELSADAHEITAIARNNCDRLVRLINDILDLEKMDAGKLELRPQSTRASALVRLAFDVLGTTGASPPPSFRGELDAELTVDVDRIVQVLVNLLSNATKFSPQGAEVTVAVTRPRRGWARFAVHDRGPGIAPDQVRKLFTRFQQLDGSDTRSKSGSGLGLAISKGIVEQHGGHIGVDSGVGSVFWFELPVVEEIDPGVADALAALTDEYAAVLPERLDELVRAIDALRRQGDDAALTAATRSAHRMHGSAGSYGFAEVGAAAGRIELALPRTRAADAEARSGAWCTVDDALRALGALGPRG